jgi:hypothetical protein
VERQICGSCPDCLVMTLEDRLQTRFEDMLPDDWRAQILSADVTFTGEDRAQMAPTLAMTNRRSSSAKTGSGGSSQLASGERVPEAATEPERLRKGGGGLERSPAASLGGTYCR